MDNHDSNTSMGINMILDTFCVATAQKIVNSSCQNQSMILPSLILIIPCGITQAILSSCNGVTECKSSSDPCCLLSPHLLIRSLSPRYLSPLLPPSSPILQPLPTAEGNPNPQPRKKPHQITTISPQPPHLPSLPVWSNWYFWLFVALLLLIGMAACGYWRRRKSYESSASQTLSHSHGLFPSSTPSDDTPLYGPPLPFLPPAAYPAPPPYSEAARPSYDRLDHQHLYGALFSGRTVYDFYDRRHPNAYYDRYFLPDDTSSSETTSLLSYRLQRSCSAHLPRHVRKCHDMPPPYSEVAAKPEMYPVVFVKSQKKSNKRNNHIATEVKSSKSMIESNPHHWLPPYHYYTYRSGSISTPEGSQTSSIPGYAHHQNVLEWWRGPRGTVSPATLLASCSGIPSPASSAGPLPSEVSSLAPTSPPSPPAPTSPTLGGDSTSTNEFREVLHKINQLPRACSPPSPCRHNSECHSPGGMLSPVPLTPGLSPGTRSCSRGSQTVPWINTSPTRPKQHLVASLSMEGSRRRPQSLFLDENNQLSSSASTPNLLREWPSLIDQLELGSRATNSNGSSLSQSQGTLDCSPMHSRLPLEAVLNRSRIVNSTLRENNNRRWWDSQPLIHRV